MIFLFLAFSVPCRVYSIPEKVQIFLLSFQRGQVFPMACGFDCIAKHFCYFLTVLTAQVIFSASCLQYGKHVILANPANCSFGARLDVNSRLKCARGGGFMRISLIVSMKPQIIPFLYIFQLYIYMS